MALEIRRTITDAHDQAILCVEYNPQRREIFTGSQDTSIKVWQSETGDHVRTLQEHSGWVTGLAFASEFNMRMLFSCSIDGRILVWSFKGELLQKEKAGGKANEADKSGTSSSGPLYCLAWDARRHHLVAGGNGHIWVYTTVADNTDLNARAGNGVIRLHARLNDAHSGQGAEEPVRGIVATDSGKIYSVGYDRALCIWDTDHLAQTAAGAKGKKKQPKANTFEEPRPMGESMLKKTGGKDNCHDGAISAVTYDPDNNWVITGSFDRSVKIWAGDGKRVAEIDGFADTLTGLCYVPATRTLWMSANSAHPIVYDPRSATDITAYLQQESTTPQQDKESKERIQRLFRIRQTGEILASTNSRQLLIWRYNPYGACSIMRAHTDWVEVLAYCYKRKARRADLMERGMEGEGGTEAEMVLISAGADSLVRRWEPASRMNPTLYSLSEGMAGHKGAVLCALYCARLDLFITSGDDGTIRLWPEQDSTEQMVMNIGETGEGPPRQGPRVGDDGEPLAERRVREGEAGPPLVYEEHTDRVTGLVCVDTTLASVSWDLSLRLWDLTSEVAASTHVIQNAHDDYILSVAYSPDLQQIGTASADQGVKLWDYTADTSPAKGQAAPDGYAAETGAPSLAEWMGNVAFVPEGKLGKRCCGVLMGHTADVSHVKWNSIKKCWVTGSEDHTVRLWSPEGEQIVEIRPPGDAITALAIDQKLGYILVASMDRAMRVYSPTTAEMVQQHTGHSDAVRCIIHVAEKRQYITASWDRTIRVWRAYTQRDVDGDGIPDLPDERAVAVRANDDGQPDEEETEGRELTYAEKNPLREPKWLKDHDKQRAGDKFLKKVSTEEDKQRNRKKKQADEEASKNVTGLSLKLQELEHTLKSQIERADRPAAREERGRNARVNERRQRPAIGGKPKGNLSSR